jgi:predicted MFS family arabinose efflux permease
MVSLARRRPSGDPGGGSLQAVLAFVLIVSGTVLGIAGTDLVLPAVPRLPAVLGGSPTQAQLVLAAFVAGTALGLLLFGELGARFDQRWLLAGSLAAYGFISAAASLAPSLEALVWLRLFQGAAGSAAAVFAPGMIRQLFGGERAVRMLGLLGSIESLVPALAPIAGVWLLARFGWRASFDVIAVLSIGLALLILVLRDRLPGAPPLPVNGSYAALLCDRVFMRYALSQACALGSLLVFVFGAPAVIIGAMAGSLTDFVTMQVVGIAFFILGANLSGWAAGRLGLERTIAGGTGLSAAGMVAILAYGVAGGPEPWMLVVLSVPVNLGFGLRGPAGFMRAVVASRGDDARGAALVVLAVLLIAAGGTAVAALFITRGLAALAGVAAVISCSGVLCLALLPRLPEGSVTAARRSN